EAAVVELNRLIDGLLTDARDTGRDIAAVGDRVVARAVLEVGTVADVPADRRQRLVVAVAAVVIGAAALVRDCGEQLSLRGVDRRGGLPVGARPRAHVADDGVVALL